MNRPTPPPFLQEGATNDGFLAAAAALLGPRGLTTDPDLLEPWLTDWRGRYTGRALALASPASAAEVAALVRLCAAHGVPIVPQGGNSGMAGGATPDTTGTAILLSLRRMNAIRSVSAEAGEAVAEAGVILQTLQEAAEAAEMRFALTLGGKGSATIGGLIATNAGGTQVLRHGTMRAQVLGLEAVMASGEVLNLMTPLKKDNRGFDLKQLLIGSEGTLGIITAARLRLLPAPRARATAWLGLSSITEAGRMLRHLQKLSGQYLEGFEVLPDQCLQSVLAHVPGARAPLKERHPWYALVEYVAEQGDDHWIGKLLQDDLVDAAEEAGLACDGVIAASQRQADDLWALRDSISGAERARGAAVQHDISVPVEAMPAFILAAVPAIETAFPGTEAFGFGHLGDGNIHFHVKAPEGAIRGVWEESEGKAISAAVHDLVTGFGGSISAEHGIGQMKVDELARLADPAALAVMRAVKQALDPQNLFNPGKLLHSPAPAPDGPLARGDARP